MLPPVCSEIELSYTQATARSYFPGAEVVMPDKPPLVRQSTLSRTLRARRHGATVKELREERGPEEFREEIREKLGGWEESTCKGRKIGHGNVDIGFSCVRHWGTDRESAKKRNREKGKATRVWRKAASSSLISRFRPFALSRFQQLYAEISSCGSSPMTGTRSDIGFSCVGHCRTDRESAKKRNREKGKPTRVWRKAASSSLISRFRPFALSRFQQLYAEVSTCGSSPMTGIRGDREGATDED
jgi:hypothetical protein